MSNRSKLVSARRSGALVGSSLAITVAMAGCGSAATPAEVAEDYIENSLEDLSGAFIEGDFSSAADVGERHLCDADVTGLRSIADGEIEMTEDERADLVYRFGAEAWVSDRWSYKIVETTERTDTAKTTVEITYDGYTTTASIPMVKEDDEWKVCLLDI